MVVVDDGVFVLDILRAWKDGFRKTQILVFFVISSSIVIIGDEDEHGEGGYSVNGDYIIQSIWNDYVNYLHLLLTYVVLRIFGFNNYRDIKDFRPYYQDYFVKSYDVKYPNISIKNNHYKIFFQSLIVNLEKFRKIIELKW